MTKEELKIAAMTREELLLQCDILKSQRDKAVEERDSLRSALDNVHLSLQLQCSALEELIEVIEE
jgi:hypothetical protein